MNYNYQQLPYQPQQQMAYRPPVQPWAPPVNATQQVRPVSSIEEVRACPIDFDGSIFYFTDVANRRIYTKQINMDGTAAFNVFELAPQAPQSTEGQVVYVTKTELDEILAEFKKSLTQIKDLESGSAPIKSQINNKTPVRLDGGVFYKSNNLGSTYSTTKEFVQKPALI